MSATARRAHWHGEPGHLNAAVRDQDSDVTGYGRHNRLVVFGGTGAEAHVITVREDVIPGREYPDPVTPELARRYACESWQRLHPRGTRLVHVESVAYSSLNGAHGEGRWSVEHTFHVVRGAAI